MKPKLIPTVYPVPGTMGTESISQGHKTTWLTQENLYECAHCKILYQNDILYDLHMQAHSTKNPFICVCGFDTTGPGEKYLFNAHLVIHEHPVFPRYTSLVSPWAPHFPAPGSLFAPKITKDIREYWFGKDTLYECGYCRILYEDDVIHNMHEELHQKLAFKCVCGFAGDKYQFNNHIYTRVHNLGKYYLYD